MRRYVIVSALALTAIHNGPAAAEEPVGERVVEARGEAPLGSGTIRDARGRAIDTAFAEGVGQALAASLDSRTRARHRKVLNAEIVRRARRFVAGFTTIAEESDDTRYRVRIRVRIDTDKLNARLAELGIGAADQAPADIRSEPRPKVVALVHASLGAEVQVSFGARGAASGAVYQTIDARLDEQGFEIASAAGTEAAPAREVPDGLPLSDDGAAALASGSGAGGAFVVGVKAWREGPIRATSLIGALATARIRVVDVRDGGASGALIAEAEVRAAGFAESEEQALTDAAARAAERAIAAVTAAAVAYWPPLIAAEDALLIEVRDYRGWGDIRALRKRLADTHGVEQVWPRQLGRRGITLAVRASIDRRRLARALRRTALDGARVDARAGGRGVLVDIVRTAESVPEDGAGGRQ